MELNSLEQSSSVVVLDTETTGFSWENGHKIIEIGAIEYVNRKPTGRTFHAYLDPERDVDEEAEQVHGWDWENLKVKSEGNTFADRAQEFLDFVKGKELVIHNAPFDMGHIDAEFRRIGWPELTGQVKVTDTLVKANNMYPGRRNNLDALSSRLNVNTRNRDLHGALLDSEILADVWLLMTTKQNDLINNRKSEPLVDIPVNGKNKINFKPVDQSLSSQLKVVKASNYEDQAHNEMLKRVEKESGLSDLVF